MAFNFRGRRVAYDNVAVGSVAGRENHIVGSSATSLTSTFGPEHEVGMITNIANAELPGIEDTDNATADKLTTDGETVAD